MHCGLEPRLPRCPEALSLVNGFVHCHLSDLNVTSEAEIAKEHCLPFWVCQWKPKEVGRTVKG